MLKRDIVFRGKSIDNGEWVEGTIHFNGKYILSNKHRNNYHEWVEIIPETVGQYTGMTDKNGTKIFEGDIVRHIDTTCHVVEVVNSEVYFDTEMLEFGFRYSNELFHCQFNNEFEVIGNIYDNKELLK